MRWASTSDGGWRVPSGWWRVEVCWGRSPKWKVTLDPGAWAAIDALIGRAGAEFESTHATTSHSTVEICYAYAPETDPDAEARACGCGTVP